MNSEIDINVRFDRAFLRIEVEDRGKGLPEEDLERVFDKFYQVPIPEGRGGTGLGLSICKGIVEAHGGRIRAQNRHGRGFVIILKLPLKSLPGMNEDHGHSKS